MKSFLPGLLIFSLLAGGAVLACTLFTLRGCTVACAPPTSSGPVAVPVRSFTSSGVGRGLELAEVRPAGANTSGSRTVNWEGKPLQLDSGEHFFAKRADVYHRRIPAWSMDGTMIDEGVLQHTIALEIADADRARLESWLGSRSGRSIAMLTGGAPFYVAVWHPISEIRMIYLSGPGEAGWTLSEATAIASSLCP